MYALVQSEAADKTTLEAVPVSGESSLFIASMSHDGELAGFVENRLFHWNRDGTLLRTVSTSDRISSFFLYDGFYWITHPRVVVLPEGGRAYRQFLAQYNEHSLQNEQKVFLPYINVVDGFLFGPANTFDATTGKNDASRPLLIKSITIHHAETRLQVQEQEPRFFRMPDLMRRHVLNFKRTWIISEGLITQTPTSYLKDGGRFMVMWQLEPDVIFFDNESINEERTHPDFSPQRKRINLPHWVQPPDKTFRTTVPLPREEWAKQVKKHYASWSRITWFGKHGTAFALAFTQPSEDGGPANNCIVSLNRDLSVKESRVVGPEWEVMGSRDGKMVLLKYVIEDKMLKVTLEELEM